MECTATRWISVEKQLPPDDGYRHYVFICSNDNGHPQSIGVAYYSHKDKKWIDDNDEEVNVDFWMDVPNLPGEPVVHEYHHKIYLAGPTEESEDLDLAKFLLMGKGFEVYCPFDHHIEHAWDYPNTEWGLMVFQDDVHAIKDSDYVVILSYGRNSPAGSNWEAGFAYGIGKRVIVVEMTNEPMSLMVANGRYATVVGFAGLSQYDWNEMPKMRTETIQQ